MTETETLVLILDFKQSLDSDIFNQLMKGDNQNNQ